MSYHRDYHEFDFDCEMLDTMYGMTDLDKEIARKGGLSNINKPMDNTVRLEAVDNGNTEYIDFSGDIVGNIERGISFVLTFVVEHDSFYATISDSGESAYEEDIKDIPHEVAEFLVGEEEYDKLRAIHAEYLDAHPSPKEAESPDEVKNALWEVIRLAKKGQQPWWSDELKEKSDKQVETAEQESKDEESKHEEKEATDDNESLEKEESKTENADETSALGKEE